MGPWPCTTGDPNPGAGPQNPHNRFPPPPRYPIRPTLISPPTPTCESGGPVNLEKAAPSPVDSGRLALAAVLFVPRLSSPASTSLALSPPISCISSDRRERTPRDRRLLSGRQGGQPSSPPTRRRRYPSRPFSSSSRSSSELENKTYLYAASGGHRPKATRNCPSSDRRRHVSHYSDLFSAYLGEITYVHRDVSTSPEPRSELTSAWRHIPSSPRPPPLYSQSHPHWQSRRRSWDRSGSQVERHFRRWPVQSSIETHRCATRGLLWFSAGRPGNNPGPSSSRSPPSRFPSTHLLTDAHLHLLPCP